MTISDDELRTRLRLGEDSSWEFKEFRFREDRPVSPSRDDLANEIGAFANAHGGTLLLGVTDDGTVQGMTRSQLQRVDALVVEVCRNSIEPPLEVEVHKMELDGAAFVVVEVPAGPATASEQEPQLCARWRLQAADDWRRTLAAGAASVAGSIHVVRRATGRRHRICEPPARAVGAIGECAQYG